MITGRRSGLACPGVRLFINFAEPRRADMRVDLGCHEALVAQQFLHAPDIGTPIEQVGGKAVTQRMR